MTSQIVNVAIVLIGVYIGLSVAASWLQEQFAALSKLRSNTLATGIAQLVSQETAMLAGLRSHPLITSAAEAGKQFPSYLEARNFTLAFWQSMGTVTSGTATAKLGQAVGDSKAALQALIDDVNAWVPQTAQGKQLRQSAAALLTAAQGDYTKLLNATDAWFNSQMDRVSGWYKRNAQYILIAIAFVLAFGGGIDSIDIGRQLFAAPEISAATAQSITAAVQNSASQTDPQAGVTAVAKAITDTQALQNLRLSHWFATSANPPSGKPPVPSDTGAEPIFGMLITAIAVSLGAPFWFDVLKSIVNVRMAGDKPSGAPAAEPAPAPAAAN